MSIYQPRSPVLRELVQRGFLHQATDLEGLDAKALAGPISAYIGFDATADSLHVGHMVQIMALRILQRHGHRPLALMGGGTTKVGDPSGRDEARRLLDDEAIAANIAGIRRNFQNFLRFEGENPALMVNNAEWLDQIAYIPFLRDVGRHFTINRMLSMDSVRLRLEREQPLTFLEFNYMILQAYDFVELNRRYGCILQLGGSDQWGNIVSGMELGRRLTQAELFGFTCPLITTASGAKMGKTANGAVWLAPEKLSPYDYWQFWRNAEDADVGRFLRLFTDLPLEKIATLEAAEGAAINQAKIRLANEATALLHGPEAAREAETAAAAAFAGQALAGAPTLTLTPDDLTAGLTWLDVAVRGGLVASKGEARRKLTEGALRLNQAVLTQAAMLDPAADFPDGTAQLTLGRKHHLFVRAP